MIKILIVDDHQLLKTGLMALLSTIEDISVIGTAESGESAIAQLEQLTPDLILMDISMPGMGGIEATKRILKKYPTIKICGFSAYNDGPLPKGMLEIGASRFISKDSSASELVNAIKKVMSGENYVCKDVASNMNFEQAHNGADLFLRLSDREKQIVKLILQGKSVSEISQASELSCNTFNAYRHRIYQKLRVKNNVELTRFAMKTNLFSDKFLGDSSSTAEETEQNDTQLNDLLSAKFADIARGMCHDLQNKLSCAKLFLTITPSDIEKVSCILNEAASYVNDLHQLARNFSYGEPQDLAVIEGVKLRKEVIKMTHTYMLISNCKITIKTRQINSSIKLPRILLKSLLLPIIQNASEELSKYRHEETGVIAPAINITFARVFDESNEMTIRVSDNGSGWPVAPNILLDKIKKNEPFSSKGQSRGFGLRNVYRIITHLGGSIELKTQPKGGACVVLHIPNLSY